MQKSPWEVVTTNTNLPELSARLVDCLLFTPPVPGRALNSSSCSQYSAWYGYQIVGNGCVCHGHWLVEGGGGGREGGRGRSYLGSASGASSSSRLENRPAWVPGLLESASLTTDITVCRSKNISSILGLLGPFSPFSSPGQLQTD